MVVRGGGGSWSGRRYSRRPRSRSGRTGLPSEASANCRFESKTVRGVGSWWLWCWFIVVVRGSGGS